MAGKSLPESRLRQKLKLNEFKLNTLLEVTTSINNNVPTHELFNLFKFILRNQLNIGKSILYHKDEGSWKCVMRYGTRGQEKKFDVEQDLLHIKDITVIESSSKRHLSSFDVVIPVYHKNVALAFLLLGDLDEQELRISSIIRHLNFIQTLANIISVANENKRLAKENLRQERAKRELEFASEMQGLLFPERLPDNEKIQVAARYQPHQQVGGDYYDYIPLNMDEFIFCMADVSGKGVSAALLMSNFQANLRAHIHYSHFSLTELVRELNHRVMATAKGEKFITLFIGKYNMETRELSYVNAAHNHPIMQAGKETHYLDVGCTGLGMFRDLPFVNEGKIKVPENAVIVAYTDGVVEQENKDSEEYGMERLTELVQGHPNDSMEELNTAILKSVDKFRGRVGPVDDITLVSLRIY